MITKQTAYDIWIALDEIDKSEELLSELADLRDSFGRAGCMRLSIPCAEKFSCHLDIQPGIAVEAIRAKIAAEKSKLAVLNQRAKAEMFL